MKKDDLHKSESKRIIFATCVLVAEGFDIPTLNMLVLTSPKSDIIQIIGRIDRKIHDNIQALIYDFVDNFSMFENQGRKRFAVYKKNKFEIEDININIETNNIKFTKKYEFHKNQDDDNNQENVTYDSDDNCNSNSKKTSKIDTEYNDINPKTNKKVNSKFIKNKEESEESVKKKNINDLFNSISLFSDK
jgi:superfamily II DNA or RNA helicase